ncbi:branched-chain amino acid ABC transporter permease [Actinospica sp.]|uniref:branched-chain amino acid ABC transporter permease n=1 Tax=Actinospica sp. TaxID=1872142 RepID=UPI002CA7638D|nr:branched-chain amino acid ABC transporter permease [Actinospica sp.]HWG27202.1 branched-chain amino acid ABC transporter permease [Actinospica sp.]
MTPLHAESRLRRAGAARAAAFLAVLAVLPFVFGQHWQVNLLVIAVMYAGLASAWNLLGGYAGYPALGHGAFFGLGAYAMAIGAGHLGAGAGYRPFLLVPLIALGTAVVVAPIARVLLRTRAVAFAVLSITVMFMVQTLAYNIRSLTGGSQGLAVPIAPFDAATFERPYYYAMAVLLVVTVGVCWVVRTSKLGLALNAVRDDEDRARGLGVQTEAVKLLAFVLSAGLTAAFGAVWAYYISYIVPGFAFDPLLSLVAVLMAFLGGRTTLWGPVVGAVLVGPAQQYFAYRFGASQLYLIAYAALFLLVIYLLPDGVIPSASRHLDRLRAAYRSHATRRDQPDQVPMEPVLPRGGRG